MTQALPAAQTLTEIVAVLSRTPAILRALLAELPQPLLDANDGEGTFSPRDVVGHLIYGERTDWIPRLELILGSGEAQPFVPFDRVGFATRSAAVTFSGCRRAPST